MYEISTALHVQCAINNGIKSMNVSQCYPINNGIKSECVSMLSN